MAGVVFVVLTLAYTARDLTREEARGVENGKVGITLMGSINYADIWGGQHSCVVFWRYNPTLKRFVPADREMDGDYGDGRASWVHRARSLIASALRRAHLIR